MAKKNNIRSMRFSDEIIEMIESQQGENFSQKFENLVTRCMWELPQKEKQLADIEKKINAQLKKFDEICEKYSNLSSTLRLASGASDDIAKYLIAQRRKL